MESHRKIHYTRALMLKVLTFPPYFRLWSQPSSWLPLQSTFWYSLAVPANGGDACS